MSIDSRLFTMEQLVNQDDAAWCFNVPIYQRLYVWGDDQIKTLLTDMANAFDRRDEQFFWVVPCWSKKPLSKTALRACAAST